MKKVYILITILICLSSFLAVHAGGMEDYIAGPGNCYNTGCAGLGGPGEGTHVIEDPNRPGHSITVHDEYSAYVVDEIQGDGFKACNLLPRVGEGGCPGMSPPHIYEEKFKGKCGCPTTPQYKIDGCQITVSCDLQDDDKTLVKVDIPCPTVAGTDPKYPLVKMLSGSLIEWRVNNEYVESPHVIKYTNHSNPDGYGTELFTGFDLNIVVSSVDTGARWDFKKAEAIVKSTEKHSRTNIEFFMTGGSPYTKVLTAKEIYDAYKTKSDYVQAYLVLANKGYKERPWTTYDKFVDAMCKFSKSRDRCAKALKGVHHENFQGNFYLGNGNPTILGVYSEISSHGCHGATAINEKNEPAFAFIFKSTFCIYMHAEWDAYYNYGNSSATNMGECCMQPEKKIIDNGLICTSGDVDGVARDVCWHSITIKWECHQWATIFQCEDAYNYGGPGQSSEDCKECIEIEGWVDAEGAFHTDPFPISFYQSQPLLVTGK